MSTNLLVINNSIMADKSQSSALTQYAAQQWLSQSDQHTVTVRDVVMDAVPHLDGARVAAFFTPEADRSDEQKAIVAYSDQLIAEFDQADALLIALPMYNFGITSQLKAYFDHLARGGVTFKYTDQGPVGLLDDKPVALIAARGGLYHAQGADHQVPFTQQFLAFLGLSSVTTVFAEGLAMGEPEAMLVDAQQALDTWVKG